MIDSYNMISDDHIDLPARIERKLETIYQKTHDLPDLISLETVTQTEHNDSHNDSGLVEEPVPDYDMDDNIEDEKTAENLPNLHISEDDDNDVMGEFNLPNLHISEDDDNDIVGEFNLPNLHISEDDDNDVMGEFNILLQFLFN